MKRNVGRRQQVLETLRGSKKARTVSDLARMLKVHGNTVRFHLDSLMEDGLIEIEKVNEEDRPVGRPAVRYRAVARVAPSQMRHTETLVRLFLGDLETEPEGNLKAFEIGKRWGESQAAKSPCTHVSNGLHRDVQSLSTMLYEMGFESDPPSNTQIMVKSCPFLGEVDVEKLRAEPSGELTDLPPVCAVHLGVMEGALNHWKADLGVEELVPFSTEDRCRIRLTRKKSN